MTCKWTIRPGTNNSLWAYTPCKRGFNYLSRRVQVKECGSMGYIVGYALVGAFLLGVLVGFGVSRIVDKE